MRKRRFVFGVLLTAAISFLICAWSEIHHKNIGQSQSVGSVGNGHLVNAYLLPYSGPNFSYFSFISYYVMDNGYVHSKIGQTVLDAYVECEESCPQTHFRVMECSDKKGGKMLLHNTHQNGLSIDFMLPKKKNNKAFSWLDGLGLWHYFLDFKNDGSLRANESITIDFETMARHILALDDAGKKHGVRVKKVILKIELKDEFYRTASGEKVRDRGIYFAKALPELTNNAHEDHYHIDFSFR